MVTKPRFDHILIIPVWHNPISIVDRQLTESLHPSDGELQVCHSWEGLLICALASATRLVYCLFPSDQEFEQRLVLLKYVIFLCKDCGSQAYTFMCGNNDLEVGMLCIFAYVHCTCIWSPIPNKFISNCAHVLWVNLSSYLHVTR